MKDRTQPDPFIVAGCWLQLTESSVVGGIGKQAPSVVLQLLQGGLVTVLTWRFGEATTTRRALGNPQRIVEGQFMALPATV